MKKHHRQFGILPMTNECGHGPMQAEQQETSMRRLVRVLAALTAAGFLSTAPAQAPVATDYPKQPVRMVVTFPPGGSADAVVRMLVPRLNDRLGQSVIVDNRPGAGGNIGLS